jgi:transcriptional regulator GlxA family with amidase domain
MRIPVPTDPAAPNETRAIVFLAAPNTQILDVAGPFQVFCRAAELLRGQNPGAKPAYRVLLASTSLSDRVQTNCGLVLLATDSYKTLPSKIDTLLVSGGTGLDEAARDPDLIDWLRDATQRTRRFGSICTGAFLLAAAGLLDGKRATTHWKWADELATRYRKITIDPDPIFIRDGNVYTTAGVTAGMDLALALVEEDFGFAIALRVAREMVLYLRRPGGQSQFSAALALQTSDSHPMSELHGWVMNNLHKDLSVKILARRAGMSPRNFARKLGRQGDLTPAKFVQQLRIEAARRRLQETNDKMDKVAEECGLGTEETMRRAFLRTLHVTPGDYRERFAEAKPAPSSTNNRAKPRSSKQRVRVGMRTLALLLLALVTSRMSSIALGDERTKEFSSKKAESQISVDEIVANYVKAIGGYENVKKIRTLISRGEYREGGEVSTDGALVKMRPYYKLVGDPNNTKPEFSEGYDGSTWEYYRDPGIVLRTVGAAAAAGRHGSAIDGPLVDYREKGSTATQGGQELIDGRKAYRVRIRMRDGFEQDEFIDAEKWLLIAERKVAPVHAFGDRITTEDHWSDFRPVKGVLFPFMSREVEIATGKVLNEMQTTSITINQDLDPSIFSPPVIQRNELQRLMDFLFQERSDVQAVMWTYHDFRRANPTVVTDESMQVIGYQMLKMGDFPSAIKLLDTNAQDYPQSTGAAFGLGRAYKAAGQVEKARREFERALQLDPSNKRAKEALGKLS